MRKSLKKIYGWCSSCKSHLKFAMHALDYCSQIALNFIKIHPACEDVSHLQKYFLTPSAFLCSAPCCPFASHQAWDFCDTLGELTHTELFQATQQQKTTQTQRALAPMRELSCPASCVHTCVPTHPPTHPSGEVPEQEAEHCCPSPAPAARGTPF